MVRTRATIGAPTPAGRSVWNHAEGGGRLPWLFRGALGKGRCTARGASGARAAVYMGKPLPWGAGRVENGPVAPGRGPGCTQASEILRRLPTYSRTILPARSRLSSELRRAARVAPHDLARLSSLLPACGSSLSTARIEARRSPLRSARLRYPALFSIIQREGRSASFLSRNVRAQSLHRLEIGDAFRSARR